jgi:hypothetical protein
MTDTDRRAKNAAFELHQGVNAAMFHILMAHTYGDRDALSRALHHLEQACATARAKLATETDDALGVVPHI